MGQEKGSTPGKRLEGDESGPKSRVARALCRIKRERGSDRVVRLEVG